MDCRGRLVALAMTAARHCERRTFYLSLRRSEADEAIQDGTLCRMDCCGRLVALAMTVPRHRERRTFYLSLRRSGADEAIQGGTVCWMDCRGRLVALAMTSISMQNGLPRLFRGLKAHREMVLSAVARRERGAFFGGARAEIG